jgi:hypothetical protein
MHDGLIIILPELYLYLAQHQYLSSIKSLSLTCKTIHEELHNGVRSRRVYEHVRTLQGIHRIIDEAITIPKPVAFTSVYFIYKGRKMELQVRSVGRGREISFIRLYVVLSPGNTTALVRVDVFEFLIILATMNLCRYTKLKHQPWFFMIGKESDWGIRHRYKSIQSRPKREFGADIFAEHLHNERTSLLGFRPLL